MLFVMAIVLQIESNSLKIQGGQDVLTKLTVTIKDGVQ